MILMFVKEATMSDIKEKETTNKEEIKENEIVGGGKQKEKKRLKGKTKKQLHLLNLMERKKNGKIILWKFQYML